MAITEEKIELLASSIIYRSFRIGCPNSLMQKKITKIDMYFNGFTVPKNTYKVTKMLVRNAKNRFQGINYLKPAMSYYKSIIQLMLNNDPLCSKTFGVVLVGNGN